jgi:predicted acyltransferase
MATTVGAPPPIARQESSDESVEPIISTVAPLSPKRERLISLDVFRGITIAGMLLVNNPGTWSAIYPPLEHAPWNGWTPTDVIFPFFLFIVGITTHLSITARRKRGDDDAALVKQILRRGGLIFLLGFLMSLFPFYQWGTIEGMPDPSIIDRIAYRWEHVRILGVLQRIGLVYIAAALLSLRTSLKQQVVIVAALLYGYWFAMTLIPVSGTLLGVPGRYIGALVLNNPSETLAAHLDRAILGLNHIWSGSVTYDPEGPLSTIPAIGTAMLGIFAGKWIGQRRPLIERIAGVFAVGCIGMVVGLMWNWAFPINKNLWTSSYVVFTAGMACATLATIMWIIEVQGIKWWTKPFVIYGINPIVAFVGSGVLARCIYTLWKVQYNGRPTPVETVVYKSVFEPWLEPRNASLAMAIATVLFWLAILTWMYRRKIFLKV